MKPKATPDNDRQRPLKLHTLEMKQGRKPVDIISQKKKYIQKLASILEATSWWKATKSTFRTAIANRPVRLIRCVGLGSFATSKSARRQLALAILVAKCCHCGTVTVCDPAMVEEDMKLIRKLGFAVEADATVRTDVDDAGVDVLIMPFCHVTLYELVLRTYFENRLAGSAVLFGNQLSSYIDLEDGLGDAIKEIIFNNVLREYFLPEIELESFGDALDDLDISTFNQPLGEVYDACIKQFKQIKAKGNEPMQCCLGGD